MSNSFDGAANDNTVAILLRGIGHEWHAIGSEILKLGETLTERAGTTLDIVQMQSFDALAQNALAQSRLVAGLARAIDDKDNAHATLSALIDDVPFLLVRQRLRAALSHAEETCSDQISDDDAVTLWRSLIEDGQVGVP